jgi:hypothetical protein
VTRLPPLLTEGEADWGVLVCARTPLSSSGGHPRGRRVAHLVLVGEPTISTRPEIVNPHTVDALLYPDLRVGMIGQGTHKKAGSPAPTDAIPRAPLRRDADSNRACAPGTLLARFSGLTAGEAYSAAHTHSTPARMAGFRARLD